MALIDDRPSTFSLGFTRQVEADAKGQRPEVRLHKAEILFNGLMTVLMVGSVVMLCVVPLLYPFAHH